MRFKKILIANRGEIALRVIRACREMGIAPVAVFSDADRESLHVRHAEEAYYIGPSRPEESYLDIRKIVDIAKKEGIPAIHPGYGFLAENADFAAECEAAGINFIGPPANVLRHAGNKIMARKVLIKSGISIIPGGGDAIRGEKDLIDKAGEIGYPLMLKASRGGGGKGIKVIKSKDELASAFILAVDESRLSFGLSEIYMERYIAGARHIEFQIMADAYGGIVHLGERECSIQRRFQKLIEESPSTALTPGLREEMGSVAIKIAGIFNYKNAGTVEFLLARDGSFYYQELNARVQVEHPVTEMITGIDIVKEQIRIAAGEPLGIRQEQIRFNGSSIECRVYAEDPYNNFLPGDGRIYISQLPGGAGVRIESSLFNGMEVSTYYDPLLAKLITWGPDRETAIKRMSMALREFKLSGVKTTIPLFELIFRDRDFINNKVDTGYIERFLRERRGPVPEIEKIAAIGAIIVDQEKTDIGKRGGRGKTLSPWVLTGRKG
ncbi:MAG: acetyl-CoA carboxylase biotin carboxylase subunit [Nitrospirota bacterium]